MLRFAGPRRFLTVSGRTWQASEFTLPTSLRSISTNQSHSSRHSFLITQQPSFLRVMINSGEPGKRAVWEPDLFGWKDLSRAFASNSNEIELTGAPAIPRLIDLPSTSVLCRRQSFLS